MIKSEDDDFKSVMIMFDCDTNCSQNTKAIIHSGVDLGKWILTQGGSLICHLLKHHNKCVIELSSMNISDYGVSPWILSPKNNYYECCSIKAGYIWKFEKLYEILTAVMSDTCGVNLVANSCEQLREEDKILAFSHFILLEKDCKEPNLMKIDVRLPCVGQEIYSVYTPFNTISFYNSWTRGTICNIIDEVLVLSDIRLTSGCQGAPAFLYRHTKELMGVVITNVAHINNDLTGFSFVAILSAVIKSIPPIVLSLPTSRSHQPISALQPMSPLGIFEYAQSCVVQIFVGRRWGSGIVVSEDGLVLTSAHVIQFGDNKDTIFVKVKGKMYMSDVVFTTSRNMSCQLAILKICGIQYIQSYPFFGRIGVVGEQVYAIGYSLFTHTTRPNVSSGIISFVSEYFLSCTCLIHDGASGGALMDKSGSLIGIITSNLKDDFIIPYVNINVSTASFTPAIKQFIERRDTKQLIEWSNSVPLNAIWIQTINSIKTNPMDLFSKL